MDVCLRGHAVAEGACLCGGTAGTYRVGNTLVFSAKNLRHTRNIVSENGGGKRLHTLKY